MNMITSMLITLVFACTATSSFDSINPIDKNKFSDYWYAGEAEITSYSLKQDRYGEIHDGTAVLVFVTEPFSRSANTKADRPTAKDPSVLKLNYTKKFNTGIYPYSMMTSTFFPVENGEHSLKISSSSQEWCGHSFTDLQNKSQFIVNVDSYFEGESKENVKLKKDVLEDDLLSMIRINPADIKTGSQMMIPSFFYLTMKHVPLKAYRAELAMSNTSAGTQTMTVTYPELGRELAVTFEKDFPHTIQSWSEVDNKSGLTTEATLMKSIKSDYWNRHSNKDLHLRTELGLPVQK